MYVYEWNKIHIHKIFRKFANKLQVRFWQPNATFSLTIEPFIKFPIKIAVK